MDGQFIDEDEVGSPSPTLKRVRSMYKCVYETSKLGLEFQILDDRLTVVRVPENGMTAMMKAGVEPGDYVHAINGIRCYGPKLPAREVLNQIKLLPRPLYLTFRRPREVPAPAEVVIEQDKLKAQLRQKSEELQKQLGDGQRVGEEQRSIRGRSQSEPSDSEGGSSPKSLVTHDSNKILGGKSALPVTSPIRAPQNHENYRSPVDELQVPNDNRPPSDKVQNFGSVYQQNGGVSEEPSTSEDDNINLDELNTKVDEILERQEQMNIARNLRASQMAVKRGQQKAKTRGREETISKAPGSVSDQPTIAKIIAKRSRSYNTGKRAHDLVEGQRRENAPSPEAISVPALDALADDTLRMLSSPTGNLQLSARSENSSSASPSKRRGRSPNVLRRNNSIQEFARRSMSQDSGIRIPQDSPRSPRSDLSMSKSRSPSRSPGTDYAQADAYLPSAGMTLTSKSNSYHGSYTPTVVTSDTFRQRKLADKMKSKVAKLQTHKSELVGTVDHTFFRRSFKVQAFVRKSVYAVMVDPENNGQYLFNEVQRMENNRKGRMAAKLKGLLNQTRQEYIMAQELLGESVAPGDVVRAFVEEDDTEENLMHELGYIPTSDTASVTSTQRGRSISRSGSNYRTQSLGSFRGNNPMKELRKLMSRGKSTEGSFRHRGSVISVTSQITEQATEELWLGALSREEQEEIIKEEIQRQQRFLDHNVRIEATRNIWNQQLLNEAARKRNELLEKEDKVNQQLSTFREEQRMQRQKSFHQKNMHADNTFHSAQQLFEEQRRQALLRNEDIEERTRRGLDAKSQAQEDYKHTLRERDLHRQDVCTTMKEQVRREKCLQEAMIHTPWEVCTDLKDCEDPVIRNMARKALTKKRTEERIRLKKEARELIRNARQVQMMSKDYSKMSDWRQRTAEQLRSPGPGAYQVRKFEKFDPSRSANF